MAKSNRKSQAKRKAQPDTHKVFLVPEFLEMILLEFDTRTLLVSAQRVCRLWREMIRSSIKLQAALFFKPVAQPPAPGSTPIRNPLLERVWREFFHSKPQFASDRWPDEWSRTLPMMTRKREEAYTRPEASWRRMLLHQPPDCHLKCFVIESEHHPRNISDITSSTIPEIKDPVRMGLIAKFIQSGVGTPCRVPWTFAWGTWPKKSLDQAEQTGIWNGRDDLLCPPSIVVFHWPAKSFGELPAE